MNSIFYLCIIANIALVQSIGVLSIFDDLKSEASEQKWEKGDGGEHQAGYNSEKGAKADKGYEIIHHYDKGEKGHNDKSHQQGHYSDQNGDKRHHHHNDGYYAVHHKGQEGEKGHKFHQEGNYSKGHSIKGHHQVHKLDEYKKHTDFYDENYDNGHHEDDESDYVEKKHESGAHYKKGHVDEGYREGHKENKGHYEKGQHHNVLKGHEEEAGLDKHHQHHQLFNNKDADRAYKRWYFEIVH